MSKSSHKVSDGPGSFERFYKVLKGLVAIPRKELQEKRDKYQKEKHKHTRKKISSLPRG